MVGQQIESQRFFLDILPELCFVGFLLLCEGGLPEFNEPLLANKLPVLYPAVDVVEWAVPILDLFVQLGKLPPKVFTFLPGHVLIPQLFEDLAEFLQLVLVPSGVELEGTLHDAAIIEIGDIDDMGLPGVLRTPFLLVFVAKLREECDDYTHLSLKPVELLYRRADFS